MGIRGSLQVVAQLAVVVAVLAEQVEPAQLGQAPPMSPQARSGFVGRPAGGAAATGKWRKPAEALVAGALSPLPDPSLQGPSSVRGCRGAGLEGV